MLVHKLRVPTETTGLVPAGRYFQQVARALADAHVENEPGIVRLRTAAPRSQRTLRD